MAYFVCMGLVHKLASCKFPTSGKYEFCTGSLNYMLIGNITSISPACPKCKDIPWKMFLVEQSKATNDLL